MSTTAESMIPKSVQSLWRRIIDGHPDTGLLLGTLAGLVAMIVIFSFTADRFFSYPVMVNILTHTSTFVVLGVGMTLVMTGGGIDISIGSIVGLAATVMGIMMVDFGVSGLTGVAFGLAVGAACGLFNGVLVAVVRIPPIIVTLGTLTFFRGLAYLLGDGRAITRFPDLFVWLGNGRILGLPVPVYIAAITVVIAHIFLTSTRTGQRITAIGGNEEAARLSGINVVFYRLLTFVIMGTLTGLATVIIIARQNAAQATMGVGLELIAISAVVLGGTSLFGGRGLILGSVMGALILGVLQTGLLLSGVVSFWQLVTLGLLLIVVVAIRIARGSEA